jgi:cyclophilin family peptidyl-prolyl cis-trans isomerase
MKPTILLSAVLGLALLGQGCPSPAPTPVPVQPTPAPSSDSSPTPSMPSLSFPGARPAAEVEKKVRIKTNQGDIVIQVDAAAGPLAASNFVYLIEQGFYNGTIFHRVIPDFMIQGGDPTGTGRGGPGYQFDNDPVGELPTKSITIQGTTLEAPVYEKGIVAMANAGPDTNGSQFFIMVGDYPLPPNYSIFGRVIEGQDVADKISALPRDPSDRPNAEVKMESVTIEE